MSEMWEARNQYPEVESRKILQELPKEPTSNKNLTSLTRTMEPGTIHEHIKYLSVLTELFKCKELYENLNAPQHVKIFKRCMTKMKLL